jgi:murein DD-endopeptidase MepM/ murein hydrolase activator NlpD
MARPPLLLLVPLLAAACATPAPPRLTFDRALADGAPRPVEDPRASRPLAEALARFAERTAALRAGTPRGAPMPAAYVEAWGEVLGAAEALATASPEATSALDLARTRVVLETALESDIGQFGDLPEALGQRITLALQAVARRLPVVLHRPRRVGLGELRWPTWPVVVTSSWGDREHPIHGGLQFHSGVDLKAERAQPVYASAPGTVVFAGWNGGYGKHLELQHDAHLVTRYSHLQSVLVSPGQVVKRGELIALAGDTGLATGPHLHFEVRRDGAPLDPEVSLPPPPSLARVSAWR